MCAFDTSSCSVEISSDEGLADWQQKSQKRVLQLIARRLTALNFYVYHRDDKQLRGLTKSKRHFFGILQWRWQSRESKRPNSCFESALWFQFVWGFDLKATNPLTATPWFPGYCPVYLLLVSRLCWAVRLRVSGCRAAAQRPRVAVADQRGTTRYNLRKQG